MQKVFLTIALAAICAFPARAQTAENVGTANAPLLQAAQRSLREFVQTKAPMPFEVALANLAAVKVAAVRGAERDKMTQAWFALFHALDSVKDPGFDPGDLPQLDLVPPPDRGVIYPAGVDPRAISDPIARAKYQKSLSANRAKAVRFAAAYPLVDLDTRAKAEFLFYRERAYTSTPSDTADFHRLLVKSGLTAARKKSLAS
jgi:hypothetical protein